MNIGRAVGIFQNLKDKRYSQREKFEAIYQTVNLETVNAATKEQLVEALRFVLNMKTNGMDTEKESLRLENVNIKNRIGEQRKMLKQSYDKIVELKAKVREHEAEIERLKNAKGGARK